METIKVIGYYDETEHSRNINLKTIQNETYTDTFSSAIISVKDKCQNDYLNKFNYFFEQYKNFQSKHEIKSTSLKTKKFRYGIQTCPQDYIDFIKDFLNLLDCDEIYLYLFFSSKLELRIRRFMFMYNAELNNSLIYSLTKLLLGYNPTNVIVALFSGDNELFRKMLLDFLEKQFQKNYSLEHKLLENETIVFIMQHLRNIHLERESDSSFYYDPIFFGYNDFLKENQLKLNELYIDKEQNTYESAKKILKEKNIIQIESNESYGVQTADLFIGLLSKLMKQLHSAFAYKQRDDYIQLKYISNEWFDINEEKYTIYKKLYKLLFINHNSFSKVITNCYIDDTILLKSFLCYLDSFDSFKEFKMKKQKSEELDKFIQDYMLLHFRNMGMI